MTRNTLTVTVESIGAIFQQRTADAFEQTLAGDVSDEDNSRNLSFEPINLLAQVFTPGVIDLLQVITQEEPSSLREAARLVEKDVPRA